MQNEVEDCKQSGRRAQPGFVHPNADEDCARGDRNEAQEVGRAGAAGLRPGMECQKGHDFPIKEPLERNRYQWKDSFDQWKDPFEPERCTVLSARTCK